MLANDGGRGASRSASLLAWSTASSVAASSDSEAEDEAREARETPTRVRDAGEKFSPVSNASQDLSRFDEVSDEVPPGSAERARDAGFAAAAAAADALGGARSVGDVCRALSALSGATRASGGARAAASSPRALRALLRVMRRCDRSDAHEPVLRLAHDVLETLSGDETGPARAVFEAKDAVVVVTEHMQMCRDRFELVGAATRTLTNLCGDARRAEAVARAECGRVTRRVQGICEILGNTLAARRHRRLAHERGSPEGTRTAFAETRSLRALEATVRSMRELVARLERCEGEVRYASAARRHRTTFPAKGDEEYATRFAPNATRFARETAAATVPFVWTETRAEETARLPRASDRVAREKKASNTSFSGRRPLTENRGSGLGGDHLGFFTKRNARAELDATTRENDGGDENGFSPRFSARPDRDPFVFAQKKNASRRKGPRSGLQGTRFASSPIMSPRYVR